jgi:hypothetical protein
MSFIPTVYPMRVTPVCQQRNDFLHDILELGTDYSKDDFCSTKEEYLCVKYLVYK